MILGDIKRDQWNEMDQDASKLNIRTLEKISQIFGSTGITKFILSCFSPSHYISFSYSSPKDILLFCIGLQKHASIKVRR